MLTLVLRIPRRDVVRSDQQGNSLREKALQRWALSRRPTDRASRKAASSQIVLSTKRQFPLYDTILNPGSNTTIASSGMSL